MGKLFMLAYIDRLTLVGHQNCIYEPQLNILLWGVIYFQVFELVNKIWKRYNSYLKNNNVHRGKKKNKKQSDGCQTDHQHCQRKQNMLHT